jgi:hypothetical protein
MDSTLLPQAVHQRRAGLNKTNFAQQKLGMYQAVLTAANTIQQRPCRFDSHGLASILTPYVSRHAGNGIQ